MENEVMKTTRRTARSGMAALLLTLVVACNKEPDASTATASSVSSSTASPPEPGAAGMMGQGMHQGQGMGMGGPGMHGGKDQPAPAASGPMMDQMRAGCPMMISDARVEVADTDKGVTLTFTTDKGDVADLRARVEHLGQMYEMHHGGGSMMWHHMGQGHRMGMMGGGGGSGAGMMGDGSHMGPMPAAKVSIEPIDKGARLVLTPSNASDLDALRRHARLHHERMRSGECWMSGNQPGGATTGTPPAK